MYGCGTCPLSSPHHDSQEKRLRGIAADIKACKDKIGQVMEKNILNDPDESRRVQYFLHILQVFEVELLVQLKEWDLLSQIVRVRSHHSMCLYLIWIFVDGHWTQEVVTSGPLAVDTYEAIADILVRATSPFQVSFLTVDVTVGRKRLSHQR